MTEKTCDNPLDLMTLAALSQCQLLSDEPTRMIRSINTVSKGHESSLVFVANRTALDELKKNVDAKNCLIAESVYAEAPKGLSYLVSNKPKKAYAMLAKALYQKKRNQAYISTRATVHTSAIIGENCHIEAGAFIGEDVVLGDGVYIGVNTVVIDESTIGSYTMIAHQVTVQYTSVGKACTIHSGARLGQDGFGFASDKDGHYKIPHIGRLVIGNNVEIGANTCIDRGTIEDTVIEDGCCIDNLVQVGHNVKIGKCSVLISQSGIAGSTKLGDFVAIGGQAGLSEHLSIGSHSTILAKCGVVENLPPQSRVAGFPARSAYAWNRHHMQLKKKNT